MPSLQIRNLDQGIYDSIVVLAKEENRSIAQQTTVLLRSALKLDAKELQLRNALKTIKKIQIKEPHRRFPTSEKLIREDRDR
ncbi:MAG: hypothetical protein J6U56_09235 [Spirochaetia bacterium]|nr:hypothetical protein [Spirochaetia bacterium]